MGKVSSVFVGLVAGVVAAVPTDRPELTIPIGFALGVIVDAVRARNRSKADGAG